MSDRTVIPATEGWFVIEPSKDADGKIGVFKLPIVAWMVEHYENVEDEFDSPVAHTHPITVEGFQQERDGRSKTILTPEGKVIAVDDCYFDSIESWLKDSEAKQA